MSPNFFTVTRYRCATVQIFSVTRYHYIQLHAPTVTVKKRPKTVVTSNFPVTVTFIYKTSQNE
jgi:hypothetical protein